jgi:hypothetical protein
MLSISLKESESVDSAESDAPELAGGCAEAPPRSESCGGGVQPAAAEVRGIEGWSPSKKKTLEPRT